MKFKPEDFEDVSFAICNLMGSNSTVIDLTAIHKTASNIANAKLQDWLEHLPLVYNNGDAHWISESSNEVRIKKTTRVAKLVCIEEIK